MLIRNADPPDWANIERLLRQGALPLEGAHEHLRFFSLATDERHTVVGCIGSERYGTSALLRSLAVAPGMRGLGVGKALVERVLADLKAAKLSNVGLLTTTAETYFRTFGFQTVARADLPSELFQSAEFQGACPASAAAMLLSLQRQLSSNIDDAAL